MLNILKNDLIIYIHLPSQATEKPSKQPPVTRGPPANPIFPEQTNIFGGGIAEAKNEFFETKCRKIVWLLRSLRRRRQIAGVKNVNKK